MISTLPYKRISLEGLTSIVIMASVTPILVELLVILTLSSGIGAGKNAGNLVRPAVFASSYASHFVKCVTVTSDILLVEYGFLKV